MSRKPKTYLQRIVGEPYGMLIAALHVCRAQHSWASARNVSLPAQTHLCTASPSTVSTNAPYAHGRLSHLLPV